MNFTPALAEMIREQRTAADLRAAAIREGFSDVWADARKKVLAGLTTPGEVLSVLGKGN